MSDKNKYLYIDGQWYRQIGLTTILPKDNKVYGLRRHGNDQIAELVEINMSSGGGVSIDAYTKEETDALLLTKADEEDIVTLTDAIDAKADKTELTSYAKKSDVPDTTNLATKTELATKADKTALNSYALKTDLSSYVTTTALNAKGYLTEVPDEYVTETELEAKKYLTAVPAGYAKTSDLATYTPLSKHSELAAQVSTLEGQVEDNTDAIALKANTSALAKVATSGSYADLTNKPTIPAAVTVDTALSTTSTNAIANKVVTTSLNSKADTGLSNITAAGKTVITNTVNDTTLTLAKTITIKDKIVTESGKAVVTSSTANSITYGEDTAYLYFASAQNLIHKKDGEDIVIVDSSNIADYTTDLQNEISTLQTSVAAKADKTALDAKADKTALSSYAKTSDLSTYLTTATASTTYATKTELAAKADKTALPTTAQLLTGTATAITALAEDAEAADILAKVNELIDALAARGIITKGD